MLELVATAAFMPMLILMRSARPANTFGKVKMVLQSVALYVLLLGGILELRLGDRSGATCSWPALGAGGHQSGVKQIQGPGSAQQQQTVSADGRPPASAG